MQLLINIKKAGVIAVILLLTYSYCDAQFGGTQAFNGTDQTIVTPTGMMNGATIFTIEFWIKTTESRSSGTYWQCPTLIGSVSAGGPSGDFGISTNNGYIGMWSGLNSSGDNNFQSASVQINDNNWHHIAAVNNGTTISLYADGVLAGSISSGLGLSTNAAPLTMGGSSLDFGFAGNIGACNFFHAGIMDEVRFSNNVRYSGNFIVPGSAFTTDANTVALYHLDGCVGGLVPDASTNTNNARPRNLTGACAFVLPPVPSIPANNVAGNISKAEYFYDADPGFGNGSDILLTASADITVNPTINIASLSNGVHRLFARAKDASGNWSLTNNAVFYIVQPTPVIPAAAAPVQIVKAEYFFDTDPGIGNAVNIPITSSFDITGSFPVDITGQANGVHRIYLRTKDAAGNWSLTNMGVFYITTPIPVIAANKVPANIIKAEYYLDTDPGFGNGTDIPVTAGTDITLPNILINLVGLPNGVHYVFIRAKDAAGNWSITNNNVFSIVAASVTIPPNPVPGSITKLEYFFDHDPGFGNGTILAVAGTTDLGNYSFVADISALNDSAHTLYVRTFDDWSITNTRTFVKGALVPLSWLSFNAKAIADSVVLNWKTANEINTDHFDIERSADGRTFTTIGQRTAANNGAPSNNYDFTDHHPIQGINYYRIRENDLSGTFKYSVIVAVRFGKDIPVTIYPNPANDAVNILFGKPQSKNTIATLIGMNGQVIQTIHLAGLQYANIHVSDLAAGVYQLRIESDGNVFTQKILVQH